MLVPYVYKLWEICYTERHVELWDITTDFHKQNTCLSTQCKIVVMTITSSLYNTTGDTQTSKDIFQLSNSLNNTLICCCILCLCYIMWEWCNCHHYCLVCILCIGLILHILKFIVFGKYFNLWVYTVWISFNCTIKNYWKLKYLSTSYMYVAIIY